MAQDLKFVHAAQAGDWNLEVIRDEVSGKVRGYIVVAFNDYCSITLNTVSVRRAGSVSVACAEALRYMRKAKEGIQQYGVLPAYRPRPSSFYVD